MSEHPPTVAILGADTVVENALAQLLEGEGYSTRVIKTSPLSREALEGQDEMPSLGVGGGVDLMVLAPSLSSRECDAFLAARKRTHQRSAPSSTSSSPPLPVIVLCSPMREPPTLLEEEDRAARSVAWPTTAERLVREIEDVLLEARFPAHRERHRRRRSSSEGGLHR
jgi:hypothetical protein